MAAVVLPALGVLLALDLAVRSPVTEDWIAAQRLELSRRQQDCFVEKGLYIDLGSKLFLDTVPQADFSEGGVHFFGTSILAASLHTSLLEGGQAERIHPFALGGASHVDQGNLIRFLVENRGLLASEDRNLVVFALFYGDAIHPQPGMRFGKYFPSMCERYGLFTYDRSRGLEEVSMTPLERALKVEQARCFNLVHTLLGELRLGEGLELTMASPRATGREQDPLSYQATWRKLMGEDWEHGMAVEVDALGKTIEYLRDHGASVVGVLMPIGSWHRELPFPGTYRELVTPLLASNEVPLIDLSESVPDELFADHSHVSLLGSEQVQRALLGIAEAFLSEGVVVGPGAPD